MARRKKLTKEDIMKMSYQEIIDIDPDELPDSLIDLRYYLVQLGSVIAKCEREGMPPHITYGYTKELHDKVKRELAILGIKDEDECEEDEEESIIEEAEYDNDGICQRYSSAGLVPSAETFKQYMGDLLNPSPTSSSTNNPLKQVEQQYEPYVSKAEKLNHVAKQYTEEQRKEKIAAVQSMKKIIEQLEKTLSGELTAGDVATFEEQLPERKNALETLTETVSELFA